MMNLICILMVYIVLLNPEINAYYDYCDFPCDRPKGHLLCSRKNLNCSHAEICDPKFEYFNFNQREIILETFNKNRDKIARGDTKFPKAANMQALRWCFELESIAQCRSNICEFEGTDYCFDTRNIRVDIILSSYVGTNKNNDTDWIRNLYENWLTYQEEAYPVANIYNGSTDNLKILRMFACADVNTVGCGYAEEKEQPGQNKHIHLTCAFGASMTYDPTLHICPPGTPVYEVGEPCTRCVASRCNTQYKHLCGETRPIHKERGVRYRLGDRAGTGTHTHTGAVMWILLCLFIIINFHYVHV